MESILKVCQCWECSLSPQRDQDRFRGVCTEESKPALGWRLTSTKFRLHPLKQAEQPPCWDGDAQFNCTVGRFKELVNAHIVPKQYDLDFGITSISLSLIWILTNAQCRLRQGEGDVVIHLIRTEGIPKSRISSVEKLVKGLNIDTWNWTWMNYDPWHEFLVFGGIAKCHVVKSIPISDITGANINHLMPGFATVAEKGPTASLKWFQKNNLVQEVELLEADVTLAQDVAEAFGVQDKDRLTIAMMFLALRKWRWDHAALQLMRHRFPDMRFDITSLRAIENLPVRLGMAEFVRGMQFLRQHSASKTVFEF